VKVSRLLGPPFVAFCVKRRHFYFPTLWITNLRHLVAFLYNRRQQGSFRDEQNRFDYLKRQGDVRVGRA